MRSSILTSKRAKALRREMTEPEVMLWSKLRQRMDDGLIFRKQHAIGPYILDFFCPKARLAVEIDGVVHSDEDQIGHDLRRDWWLGQQGVSVYRISASAVFANLTEIAHGVRLRALERTREEAWRNRGNAGG